MLGDFFFGFGVDFVVDVSDFVRVRIVGFVGCETEESSVDRTGGGRDESLRSLAT